MNDLRDLRRSVGAAARVWTAKDYYIYRLLYIQKKRGKIWHHRLESDPKSDLQRGSAETHEFLLCRSALSYLHKPGSKILGGPCRAEMGAKRVVVNSVFRPAASKLVGLSR